MIRQVIPTSIPTLRFFALTGARAPTVFEEAATQSRDGDPASIWRGTGADEALPEPEADAIEELDRRQPSPFMRVTTCRWRVVRTGEKSEWELLTIRKAAAIQQYIADADFEKIERLHGELTAHHARLWLIIFVEFLGTFEVQHDTT